MTPELPDLTGAPGAQPIVIRPMVDGDWPRVAEILAEGIATGNATFETSVPTWKAWDAAHLGEGRLVAEVGGVLLGWAALSPVSSRCVYAGVAEVSVYVTASSRRLGVGRTLLRGLIDASERAGMWTLQAGIFPENEASRRLHRAEGFRELGRRERVGRLGGRWRDVVLLERRSRVVGAEEADSGGAPSDGRL